MWQLSLVRVAKPGVRLLAAPLPAAGRATKPQHFGEKARQHGKLPGEREPRSEAERCVPFRIAACRIRSLTAPRLMSRQRPISWTTNSGPIFFPCSREHLRHFVGLRLCHLRNLDQFLRGPPHNRASSACTPQARRPTSRNGWKSMCSSCARVLPTTVGWVKRWDPELTGVTR
jgi:hypothetical protein